MDKKQTQPRCVIIAGPTGAGKTTFAREFLPVEADIVHFVNADLIAAGLSPLKPELAALRAGRLLLSEPDRLALARLDFAFETTLSGLVYAARIGSGNLLVTGLRSFFKVIVRPSGRLPDSRPSASRRA